MPGLLVYRFDGPLFFANGEYFKERVHHALELNPGDEHEVVLDMEGVGSIDTTAVDHVDVLIDELERDGLVVSIARPNQKVLDLLTRAGITERLGTERIFPTINAAVSDYRRRTDE